MSRRTYLYYAVFLLVSVFTSGTLPAQTVCDQGNKPLDPAQPAGVTPAEIIQRFAAKEAIFKAARDRYGYNTNVLVQTLDIHGRIDGEYQQVSEIILDDAGKRVEKTTFAPQSTLRRLSLTEDDLDDIRQRLPFALTPEELPHFSVSYAGRQHVDQLSTYVFDVAPKDAKKDTKLFNGRIWVDVMDLMVVKTCGKPRQNENAKSTKKNMLVNLTPLFVTYREEFGGRYWFPTYLHADEFLSFPRELVHIREVVKFTDYKPLNLK
jgi:hypothetical protein